MAHRTILNTDTKAENKTTPAETLAFVDVKPGKKTLVDKQRIVQNPQKGNTCWYASFNFLRNRIGKLELKDKLELKESENPDVTALLRKRYIEKTFSDYRRQIIENDNSRSIDDFFNLLSGPEANTPYLINKISIAEALLKKLNYNIKTELLKQIDLTINFERTIASLTPKEKALLLGNLVIRIAAEEYHLKISQWDPSKGFKGLTEAIKLEGILCVGTHLGQHAYTTKPIKTEETLANYRIYFWSTPTRPACADQMGHKILVVGTQLIKTDSGSEEAVLFVDPNDISKPKNYRKVYRVSYAVFCNNLMNIYSCDPKQSLVKAAPFAYCANTDDILETERQYARAFTPKE